MDLIQGAVVSDAEAVDAGFPSEGLDPRRTRGVLEGQESFVDPLLNVLRESEESAFSGRLEDEAVATHLHEPRLQADLLIGNGFGFFAGDPNRFHVEAVFELFEELKVLDGHERGDGLPVAFQDDPFPLEGDSVEGVSQSVTHGGGGESSHVVFCPFRTFCVFSMRDSDLPVNVPGVPLSGSRGVRNPETDWLEGELDGLS